MNISLHKRPVGKLKTAGLFFPVSENAPPDFIPLKFLGDHLPEALKDFSKATGFAGKLEDHRVFYTQNRQIPLIILLGLGKPGNSGIENYRRWFGKTVKVGEQFKLKKIAIFWDPPHTVPATDEVFFPEMSAALLMADFRVEDYRRDGNATDERFRVETVELVVPHGDEKLSGFVEEGIVLGNSVNFARRLGETPPNVLTPAQFVEEVKKEKKTYNWKMDILDKKELKSRGLNAILSVASGSANDPYLLILRHTHPRAKKTIALVGKGVTFDTGGISIKPSKQMDRMKYDMGGAAAVVGAMMALSAEKLPANVVGVIPLVENMPSATATRPGDIVKSYSGYHIEVLNTDAEGRLILADALSYAVKNYQPDVLVDLATLTGAVVVALGHLTAGILGNKEELLDQFRRAADLSGERVWPLPTWDDYAELLRSEIADIANISSKPGAGTITAAMFLKKFVEDLPWVHLDIAGTAFDAPERSYQPPGATGFGVRLLYNWLKHVHLSG